MSESVHCELEACGIARLVLDEPASRANTLHRGVWEQLGAACDKLASQRHLRGLVIQSAKPGIFVAGADLREISALPTDDPEPTRELVRRGRDVLAALEALPFPTVAMIDGAALGGGFELALACDYRLAGTHPKIKIGLPEVKLGLIPGWGGTQRPARIIGLADAARLVCTGETLSAESAREHKLIDGIATSENLEDAAVGLIITHAMKCTWQGRRQAKRTPVFGLVDLSSMRALLAGLTDEQRPAGEEALRVVAAGATLPLDDGLRVEEDAFVPLVASANSRKLIAAFLQR